MNLLTVDIGNTDVKFAIFRHGKLLSQWRATGTRTFPERFSAMLRDRLARTGIPVEAVVYTSVVPEVEQVFCKTLQYCFNLGKDAIVSIQPDRIQLPLDMSLYPLEQLGMDRLVDACAARLLYPDENLIVIDFGTATTFDLVSADGVYLGGAIAPELVTFCDSLPARTAKLPNVNASLLEKSADDIQMGTNTVTCMEAGLGFGYRGLLKELLVASIAELGSVDYKVIGTGGLAETVIRLCGMENQFHTVDPVLTLRGLSLLHDYNRRPALKAAEACPTP